MSVAMGDGGGESVNESTVCPPNVTLPALEAHWPWLTSDICPVTSSNLISINACIRTHSGVGHLFQLPLSGNTCRDHDQGCFKVVVSGVSEEEDLLATTSARQAHRPLMWSLPP